MLYFNPALFVCFFLLEACVSLYLFIYLLPRQGLRDFALETGRQEIDSGFEPICARRPNLSEFTVNFFESLISCIFLRK